jgi:hypothetical protein
MWSEKMTNWDSLNRFKFGKSEKFGHIEFLLSWRNLDTAKA